MAGTTESTSLRRFAAGFLLTVAFATVAWWIIMLTSSRAAAAFIPEGMPRLWLHGFLLADGVVYCGTAVAAAVGLITGRRGAHALLCAHAGAAAYACLTCLAVSWMTSSAWWGVALMSPAAVIAVWLAWRLRNASS